MLLTGPPGHPARSGDRAGTPPAAGAELAAPSAARSGVVGADDAVERVALDGDAAGGADKTHELILGHLLGGGGTGHVVDALLHDRAVEVVDAELEQQPGGVDPEHDPVRLEVRDVVEQQAADGEDARA